MPAPAALIAASLATAASFAQAPAAQAPAALPQMPELRRDCPVDARVRPVGDPEAGRFRRLGDLPPAAHLLTVFRVVDGCPAPVIVRADIGAGIRARRPTP